jgi:hypothetical protein
MSTYKETVTTVTQEIVSPTEQKHAHPWLMALKQIFPIYAMTHTVFLVVTVFSALFTLHDFSSNSLPLHTLLAEWNRWDTGQYIGIATSGYNAARRTAFFPLFPLSEHVVALLVRSPFVAGLLIANVADLIMMVILYQLVKEDFGEEQANRAVIYLSIFPTAFFFASAYTESLFLCLVLLSFYHMRHSSYWLAGLFGFCACLTRSAGIMLIIPFAYEYSRQHDFSLKQVRIDILSIALVPFALASYAAYCYWQFGDPLAFSHAEYVWARVLSFPGYGVWLSVQSIMHSHGLISFQALRNCLETGIDICICLLIILSIVGPWKFPGHLRIYAIYAAAMYTFLQMFPVHNAFPLEANSRFMLEIFPAFIMLAILGKYRAFHYNYLMVSCALLCLLLLQFLTGHWVT